MKDKIRFFLQIWGVILLLNQAIIFGGCFHPKCIIAALPHTAFISFLIYYFFERDIDLGNTINIESNEEENPLNPFMTYEQKQKEEVKKTFHKTQNIDPFEKSWKPSEGLETLDVPKKEKVKNTFKQAPKKATKKDPYKEKGDKYEKYIGNKFEEQGYLVIYNGFIKGYADKGIDIISISMTKGEINLIQCKNWTKKRMGIDEIDDIFNKLNNYDFDCCNLEINTILKHSQQKKHPEAKLIFHMAKHEHNNYTIRKTLYVSSDKVMDLNIGKYLTMIKPNIFRYKDMKIVIEDDIVVPPTEKYYDLPF